MKTKSNIAKIPQKSVSFFSKKIKPKPSVVFDTYWNFAAKRQQVFMKRLNGEAFPWIEDDIINQYRFTNVYRASDRVSQYLIKKVIYENHYSQTDLFFRIILFKTFNKISTWEFLENEIGPITFKNYSFEKYDRLLTELLNNKIAIYSAAYIMASGGATFGLRRKHQNHLKLIELMIRDNAHVRLQQSKTMHEAYEILLSYPTIGEFLAYQYVTDVNYSLLTNFSELEFVKAGPGAKDGIAKCFKNFGDFSFEDIIHMMVDNQEEEFARLGLNFTALGGRKLQLIDCQNIFCEVDKYSRIAHPEFVGYSQRTRIKQKYSPNSLDSIDYFFPPKWNMNLLV